MTTEELRELAGPIGVQVAGDLTGKVCNAVDGFPASNDEQLFAICRLIGDAVIEHGRGYLA